MSPLRVITLNLNGIRAAHRKGGFTWLLAQNADVICVQEIKAQEAILADPQFALAGYQSYFHCAEKKGYSGVGIYTRHHPKTVVTGIGLDWADREGRYVAVDLGGLWVASLYLPSGTSGEARQALKYDLLAYYRDYLTTHNMTSPSIICGDFNIAHKAIDLKNWRANQTHSGFLPEERAWMDHLFNHMGFVDAFRVVNQEKDQYTWWSHRGRAWEKNVGWRIDYQVLSPTCAATVKAVSIYKDQRFSDHAPLIVDYEV